MYFCFMDESGTPPKPSAVGKRPYFVIAAVIMHEAQWHGISDELKRLRLRPEFKVKGEIKWRYFGKDNADPDNSVKHLSQPMRDKFREAFFDILVQRKSIRTLACITDIAAAYSKRYVKTPEDLYSYTYKPVSERFQYYLQDMSRQVGDKQLGIMVADHRGKKQDDGLRTSHHGLIDNDGLFSSNYPNYIETVFMTPSHLSVGIQFADMVAGAVARSVNTSEKSFFEKIKGTLRSGPTGKVEGFGLVRFPGR